MPEGWLAGKAETTHTALPPIAVFPNRQPKNSDDDDKIERISPSYRVADTGLAETGVCWDSLAQPLLGSDALTADGYGRGCCCHRFRWNLGALRCGWKRGCRVSNSPFSTAAAIAASSLSFFFLLWDTSLYPTTELIAQFVCLCVLTLFV